MAELEKEAKFTLKSGNSPTFKVMGSSPGKMNNFGIGRGGSPWKEDDDNTNKDTDDTNGDDDDDNKKKNDVDEQGGDKKSPDKPWVKALKIGTTLLSGGIQGVYGGTRQYPKINWGKKEKEPTQSPEDKVNDAINGDGTTINNTNKIENGDPSSETTYTVQSGNTLSQIAKDNNTTVEELMKKNPDIKNKNVINSGQTINL